MATMTTPVNEEVQGGEKVIPVFFKQNEIISIKEHPLTTLEVCRAAEKAAGVGSIEGAQVIKNLWRIYCKTNDARQNLLEEKLSLRNITIDIYDQNPYTRPAGENTYLAIHDIPLSYDNTVIQRWLETHGFPPVSSIKYQYARDEQNKLTSYKTGSRFVYVGGDPAKIPDRAQIGLFTAKLWHPGLKKQKATLKCSNCLQTGHIKANCQSQVVCLSCKQEGHRKGECPLEAEPQDEDINTIPQQDTHPGSEVDELVIQKVAALLAQSKVHTNLASSLSSHSRGTPPPRGRWYHSYRTPLPRKRGRSDPSREQMNTKKKDVRRTPKSSAAIALTEECEFTDESDVGSGVDSCINPTLDLDCTKKKPPGPS